MFGCILVIQLAMIVLPTQFLTMNMKDNSKINVLSVTLAGFFCESMNLAQIRFFSIFISAL